MDINFHFSLNFHVLSLKYILIDLLCFCYVVLGLEPRVLSKTGKHSVTKLYLKVFLEDQFYLKLYLFKFVSF